MDGWTERPTTEECRAWIAAQVKAKSDAINSLWSSLKTPVFKGQIMLLRGKDAKATTAIPLYTKLCTQPFKTVCSFSNASRHPSFRLQGARACLSCPYDMRSVELPVLLNRTFCPCRPPNNPQLCSSNWQRHRCLAPNTVPFFGPVSFFSTHRSFLHRPWLQQCLESVC